MPVTETFRDGKKKDQTTLADVNFTNNLHAALSPVDRSIAYVEH